MYTVYIFHIYTYIIIIIFFQFTIKPSEANDFGIVALPKPFTADFVKLKGISGDITEISVDLIGKEYRSESAFQGEELKELDWIYIAGIILSYPLLTIIFISHEFYIFLYKPLLQLCI